MAVESIYTISLGKVKHRAPGSKRAAKAARHVRRFIAKHMKSENVKIGPSLNRKLWERGIRKLPPKVRVRARTEEDGSVLVELAD